MNKCILKIENLSSSYEDILALDNVSLEIPEGLSCAIVGPNGAGKTTLLKTILGLNEYKSFGNISLFPEKKNFCKRDIAYVPQRKNVDWSFPITVYETVLMGSYDISKSIFSVPSKEAHRKTEKALELMNIKEFSDSHIDSLSGGQQQRVFIARSLAQEADLYIMDEPLTGLDKKTEKIIADTFSFLTKNKKTVIAVHHDWNTLSDYFDWVVFLNKKIFYSGPLKNINVKEYIEKTFN